MLTENPRSIAAVIAATAVIGGCAAYFGIAAGQETAPPVAANEAPAPVVLDIGNDGSALVRGTVTAVNDDSVTVGSWGGEWTIRMNVDGSVMPSGTAGPNDIAAINVGDLVGAEGTVATGEPFTVYASFMRDWTTNPLPDAFEETATGTAETTLLVPDTIVEPGDTMEDDTGATDTDTALEDENDSGESDADDDVDETSSDTDALYP